MKKHLPLIIFILFITHASAQTISLWGITSEGGNAGEGTLYSVNPDGSNFTVRHYFQGPAGFSPIAGVVQSSVNGKIYGACAAGGDSGSCTVWQEDPVTGDYEDIYSFGFLAGDQPAGGLVEGDDGILYGATFNGGLYDMGVIYSINPSTREYKDIYDFSAQLFDLSAITTPVFHDGKLYWFSSLGVVSYEISTAALTTVQPFFNTLSSFNNASPSITGNIVKSTDGKLYGIASSISTGSGHLDSLLNSYWDSLNVTGNVDYNDSINNILSTLDSISIKSTLFSVNMATAQYSELHSIYSFMPTDNYYFSSCCVTLSADGKLYGTLSYDYDNPEGIIFSYDISTNDYRSIYAFTADDPATSPLTLMEYNGQLIGTSLYGGASYNYSTLFSYNKATGELAVLYTFDVGLVGYENSPSPVNIIATGISQINRGSFSVYPNPASTSVSVCADADNVSEIIFYDLTGRPVSRAAFTRSTTIDVSNLAAGMYTYQLYNNNTLAGQGKIVKL